MYVTIFLMKQLRKENRTCSLIFILLQAKISQSQVISPALPQKVFTEGEKAFLISLSVTSVTIKHWYALGKQQDRQNICQRLFPPPCQQDQLFLLHILSQPTTVPSFKYRWILPNMFFNIISRLILHFYCKFDSQRSSSIFGNYVKGWTSRDY